MSEQYDFDVAVIGSGPGGYVAAIRAAQRGATTCVIEKGEPGGVCTNVGCIPTKVFWHSARVLKWADSAAEFGVEGVDPRLNYATVATRRDEIVRRLGKGVRALLSGNDVELIRAEAAFKDPHTLTLEGGDDREQLTAETIMIATGSRPVELSAAPFDHKEIIDSSDAVRAEELPKSVVIVGGGYVGVEFAGIYAAFGCKVTVVEMLDSILPAMDADCSRAMASALKKAGVDVRLGTTLEEANAEDDEVHATLSDGEEVHAEKMLVCVGRQPDCSGLQIQNAGLERGDAGQIPVNEHMQSSVPHIYAVGDVTGGPLLAHMASHEGLVAADHATGTITAAMDYRLVPAGVFAFPEIATVGLTEQEAKDTLDEVTVKRFPFSALGKAHILDETDGFVKAVADAATGELVGIHICGPEASSLLGEACVALGLECTAEELADTVHAHPTLAEALHEVAGGLVGLPVNWRG